MHTQYYHQFGDIDRYQKKKKTKERIEAMLFEAIRTVRNQTVAEYVSQHLSLMRPPAITDDSTLPNGNLVKQAFLSRTDSKEACLLCFIRFTIMQYWALSRDEIDNIDAAVSLLEQILNRYHNAKIVGSVKDGFTFDVVAEATGDAES